MKFFSSEYILEKSDLATNSSHIFLLKHKLTSLTDDFVEGYNVWEKSKAELIIQIADTLEKLHELREYTDDINTISTYIRQTLAERGVSQGQLDYVTDVLPAKYKNENLSRDTSAWKSKPVNNNNETVNIYQLEKQLEQMSSTELQDYGLELEQKHKHFRTTMKAEKEALEFVAIKKKIPLFRYKKESATPPPDHLHRETTLWEEAKLYSQYFFEFYKYFEDIAQSIKQYPPDPELEKRTAHKMKIFRFGVLKTLKALLIPYTDRKWSADWVKWIDIHLTRLEHSKNYAGSKHALETGEKAVKIGKDGKPIIINLERGITREQVGDKEPELFKMVQQMIVGIPMINALNDWAYKAKVHEEYDEHGEPVL